MSKKYRVASLVSWFVYLIVGPFISIVTWPVPEPGTEAEADIWPIGLAVGWVVFGVLLTAAALLAALGGEAVASRVGDRPSSAAITVSLVSGVILFGCAALISRSSAGSDGAFLGAWVRAALFALPGWLVVGVGPRLLAGRTPPGTGKRPGPRVGGTA